MELARGGTHALIVLYTFGFLFVISSVVDRSLV
jgi:hypothetical protein